jgi:hypothetical protein
MTASHAGRGKFGSAARGARELRLTCCWVRRRFMMPLERSGTWIFASSGPDGNDAVGGPSIAPRASTVG